MAALAKAEKIQNGYKIRGIEPPDLRDYDPSTRKLFWGWVVELGLKRKDKELSQGLDKDGKPLRPISQYTREHRKSAMTPSGRGDPNAPPLTPGWQKSRTRSLLAGRAFTTHAAFFWKYDPWTGASWAEVAVRPGQAKAATCSAVINGIAWVKAQAWARWEKWKSGRLRPPVTRLDPPDAWQRQCSSPTSTSNTSTTARRPREVGPRRRRSSLAVGDSTPEERRKYFSQTASAQLPGRAARPKSKSPESGPRYSRLLQHIWGTQTFPGRGGSAPAPPKPKPPAKPKTPKPTPSIPPPKPTAPTWSPTMTAAEAEQWSRNSLIRDELTHVTTEAAASSIEKGGFRLDVAEKMGRIWGNGTYLGLGPE